MRSVRGMRTAARGHLRVDPKTAALPDVVLDDGVLARKPVLVAQPLEDALGRVALLPGDLGVFFNLDAVDDARL